MNDTTVWWKGARGEWYVVIQLALFALIAFGPQSYPSFPAWSLGVLQICYVISIPFAIAGLALIASGIAAIRAGLTPLPYPTANAKLVTSGPFRIVRHPIYSGGIFLGLGWGLWVHGWLTLGYVFMLVIFLDIKSRREEVWMMERFPEYAAYQKRVRKLIPFIY